MLVCCLLVALAYFSFGLSDSAIFHPVRWLGCGFMTSDSLWKGFHLFKNIGEFLLFGTGFFAAYYHLCLFDLMVLVVVAGLVFNITLHVIFK